MECRETRYGKGGKHAKTASNVRLRQGKTKEKEKVGARPQISHNEKVEKKKKWIGGLDTKRRRHGQRVSGWTRCKG